ncbi:MAG: endo-1,4-beta-xylanase [Puniceicoccaceae bacterium]|nr:endo-1,4-beta-xylanase [Puniceicoccaceae bacterium]
MPLRQIVQQYYPDGNVYIGAATGMHKYSYTSGLMDREFSYLTPENDFKQHTIHPSPGKWSWDKSDAWVAHAAKHGQVIRMHGPISPQVSKWTLEDHRTAEELSQNMDEYMTALCQRYNGHPVVKWMDVVNETVVPKTGDWFGPKPGVSAWQNPWPLIGFDETHPLRPPLYIKRAFEIATEHATDIELVLNQHGGMEPQAWDKVRQLVGYLREHGLRVDGIGWQAHVDLGWEKVPGNLEYYAELIDWAHTNQLSFHVTENTVWLRKDKDHAAQAETFAAIMRVLLSKRHSGVVTWNTWNISDADSWKKEQHLDGCLFDYDYAPKPAYYAVQRVLLEIANAPQ